MIKVISKILNKMSKTTIIVLIGILLLILISLILGIPQALGQAALQQVRILSGTQIEVLGEGTAVFDIATRVTDGGPIHIYARSVGAGIYIDPTNNVGIGTIAPTANTRLDVVGNARIGGNLTVTGSSNICTLATTCPGGYTRSSSAPIWKSCEVGSLSCGHAWNHSMGYRFTPTVAGQITHLCGHFNGTRWVRIYNAAFGILASSSITSANNWVCNAITPVNVTAAAVHYVVAELAGSGGCMRSGIVLPINCAGITINNSVFQSPSGTFSAAHSSAFSEMYGVADIVFVPSTGSLCCQIP